MLLNGNNEEDSKPLIYGVYSSKPFPVKPANIEQDYAYNIEYGIDSFAFVYFGDNQNFHFSFKENT
jgi:hypothetical protein